MKTVVIIPILNEEEAIPLVLAEIPKSLVDEIVVVDSDSKDRTVEGVRRFPVHLVEAKAVGYGDAMLQGLEFAKQFSPEIVVFLDGDYSDYPEDVADILSGIQSGEWDFVLGSRTMGRAEPGSIMWQARWGNTLSCFLIRLLYGFRYTDMGPFRAMRFDRFQELRMNSKTFGWNAEMQVKAIQKNYRIKEVSVRYRNRVGHSKISGTVSGTVKAGILIIYNIIKYQYVRW